MFYIFGFIYITICIQRINDAAVSPPIIRPAFQDALSLIFSTVYVLIGITGIYSALFLLIALFWLVTSMYLSGHKKVFIFRSLINVALVSIVIVKHFYQTA